jgi:hypothetical protein
MARLPPLRIRGREMLAGYLPRKFRLVLFARQPIPPTAMPRRDDLRRSTSAASPSDAKRRAGGEELGPQPEVRRGCGTKPKRPQTALREGGRMRIDPAAQCNCERRQPYSVGWIRLALSSEFPHDFKKIHPFIVPCAGSLSAANVTRASSSFQAGARRPGWPSRKGLQVFSDRFAKFVFRAMPISILRLMAIAIPN